MSKGRGPYQGSAGASPYRAEGEDRLPPHSDEAERGCLGCVLLDVEGKHGALDKVCQRILEADWFYDVRHRSIWLSLLGLRGEGVRPDSITLIQRLKDCGNLENAGGVAYVSTLADTVPSVEQLDYYLTIVREKFVARAVVALCTRTAASVTELEGALESRLNGLAVEVGELQVVRMDPAAGPQRMKKPAELIEPYWDAFFGGHNGEPPGKYLPIAGFKKFPFKFRPAEMTFLLGNKGNGKSTLLSEILLHLAAQGERIIIASMETPGGVSLKMLASQLLGETRLPNNAWGHEQARAALAWLSERVFIYDFLGIADWRHMLPDFRYAAREWGATVASVDSVMRLGIPDDDYAQQGQAAIQFVNLANEEQMHLVVVNHLNKSDRRTVERSRGSQQWIDNSHNVVSVEKNEKKHEKLGMYQGMLDTGTIRQEEYENLVRGMKEEWLKEGKWWDANFVLHYQRYPGSQTNGSRRLYYTKKGLQYADRPDQEGGRWLEAWKGRKEWAGEVLPDGPLDGVQMSGPVQTRLEVEGN